MNKLIIIGNGFDLAHKLKTRYSDFMLWYVQKVVEAFNKRREYNDKLYSLSLTDDRILKFTLEADTIDQYKQQLKLYKTEVKSTPQSDFFDLLFQKTSDPNWIDIESEFYNYLKRIYRDSELWNSENIDSAKETVSKLNSDFQVIKEKLQTYLIDIEKNGVTVIPDIAKLLQKKLITRVNEFSHHMILNFNYTSTVEHYLKNIPKDLYSLNYIHGKLNDKQNPIIFGYGDEIDHFYKKIEDLNCNVFLENFKSFGYLKTKNYQQFTGFLGKNDTFEVHILGHSCGLSDRVLFKRIVEHPKCKSIEIHYHKKSEEENDYLEKTFELSRHFSLENKGLLRERVVPFDESHPLVDI